MSTRLRVQTHVFVVVVVVLAVLGWDFVRHLFLLLDWVLVAVLDRVLFTLLAGDLLGHLDWDVNAVLLGDGDAVLLGDLLGHVVALFTLHFVTVLLGDLLGVLERPTSYERIQIENIQSNSDRTHLLCPVVVIN